ncbi:GTP cyclohydrolase I [Azospirillum formosense]|uniref:GTP cyclohydrolase I n=1 Tax=Azospirillum formosense TaxID=861533 RepID=A0ABX2L5A4_9PROT|nr:GTP cyclohydrolase I [Azospirillum formosense]MBY3754070.1 GTP cyclohydrolase I [Azospirillum formosense]NUB22349.1 GTP cyclohydrolase I [Azospirillum formosense]
MTVQANVLALVQEAMEARRSNEALDTPLDAAGEAAMIDAAARKVEELLDVLRIDHRNDHNTRDTPRRVAKMLVRELLKGRFTAAPELTEFRNAEEFDHLIVTGPIAVRSTCAHHLMPIYGTAFIGILPAKGGNILGLSKYDRIVDHFAARFQIQEELVKQIANFIVEATRPRGLAVRISAVHMCKTHRGVRAGHDSRMVNSSFHGEMLESRELREEFLRECATLERSAR